MGGVLSKGGKFRTSGKDMWWYQPTLTSEPLTFFWWKEQYFYIHDDLDLIRKYSKPSSPKRLKQLSHLHNTAHKDVQVQSKSLVEHDNRNFDIVGVASKEPEQTHMNAKGSFTFLALIRELSLPGLNIGLEVCGFYLIRLNERTDFNDTHFLDSEFSRWFFSKWRPSINQSVKVCSSIFTLYQFFSSWFFM